METTVIMKDQVNIQMVNRTREKEPEESSSLDREPKIIHHSLGRRSLRGKRRGLPEKRRVQKQKRWGQEEKKDGVTVKRTWGGGKRRWDKKHYCAFCHRPQVKIARHLLRKHSDEQEVMEASVLPTGSKQRHLLLEHLRCRGNYLHNIEVIRQGSGEIVPWRQPSEEVDARNYLPCPLCLGFFLRADLWKHQASCRRKLAADLFRGPAPISDTPTEQVETSSGVSTCDPGEQTPTDPLRLSTPQLLTPDVDQNQNSAVTPPRKRTRVQAAASRLLPISSGASESCSEILHRMNQDTVSHQVKSDWLICKYGNKLMGNIDGGPKRYDYLSQKLRELGRLLLAAKSLDSDIQTLQNLLAPGRLSLVLSAAREASGYRWSRPPLSVKTMLKAVCEVAIEESLQAADWETAAKTTDFYHMLGKEWDTLSLENPNPDPEGPEEGTQPKKRVIHSHMEKDQRPDVLLRIRKNPEPSQIPPESRLRSSVSVPAAPRKVRRRPWSSEEKEAIWRQLGAHVLAQSVPGKEVCQRCLDLEAVLRGRHWKDVKNQVHNQIQSQKKQQFHAQMDLEENQTEHTPNQSCQTQIELQSREPAQNQKKPLYQVHMDLQIQDSVQNKKKKLDYNQHGHQDQLHIHKKHLCHMRLDLQNHSQVLKKHQMDHQNQALHSLVQNTPSVSPYGPDGPLRAPEHLLLDQEPNIPHYPVVPQPPRPQMDPLLSRTSWTDETLAQNFSISKTLLPGGPLHDPNCGHVQF
uniref:Uncharacterized protein n=1 Tax=Iconisemion striatum TaxID=60296 RepID=A0A1A7X2E6_9TELE